MPKASKFLKEDVEAIYAHSGANGYQPELNSDEEEESRTVYVQICADGAPNVKKEEDNGLKEGKAKDRQKTGLSERRTYKESKSVVSCSAKNFTTNEDPEITIYKRGLQNGFIYFNGFAINNWIIIYLVRVDLSNNFIHNHLNASLESTKSQGIPLGMPSKHFVILLKSDGKKLAQETKDEIVQVLTTSSHEKVQMAMMYAPNNIDLEELLHEITPTYNFGIITGFFIENYGLTGILKRLRSFVKEHEKLPVLGIASRIHDGQLMIAHSHNHSDTGAKFDEPSLHRLKLTIVPDNQLDEQLLSIVRDHIKNKSLEKLVIYRSNSSSSGRPESHPNEVSDIQKLLEQSRTRFTYIVAKEIVIGSNQPIYEKVVDGIGFTDQEMTQLTAEVSLHSQIKRIPAPLAMAQMSIARMVVHYEGFKQSINYEQVAQVQKGFDQEAYKVVKKYSKSSLSNTKAKMQCSAINVENEDPEVTIYKSGLQNGFIYFNGFAINNWIIIYLVRVGSSNKFINKHLTALLESSKCQGIPLGMPSKRYVFSLKTDGEELAQETNEEIAQVLTTSSYEKVQMAVMYAPNKINLEELLLEMKSMYNFRIITGYFRGSYKTTSIENSLQSFVKEHKKLPVMGIAARIHDGQLMIAQSLNNLETGAKFDEPSFHSLKLKIVSGTQWYQLDEQLVSIVRDYIRNKSLEKLVIYRSHVYSSCQTMSYQKEVSDIQKLMEQSRTRFTYILVKGFGSNKPIFEKVVDGIGFTDEQMTHLTTEVSLHSQIKRIPAPLAMAHMSITMMVVHYDGFTQSENYKQVVRVKNGLDQQAYKAVKKYLKSRFIAVAKTEIKSRKKKGKAKVSSKQNADQMMNIKQGLDVENEDPEVRIYENGLQNGFIYFNGFAINNWIMIYLVREGWSHDCIDFHLTVLLESTKSQGIPLGMPSNRYVLSLKKDGNKVAQETKEEIAKVLTTSSHKKVQGAMICTPNDSDCKELQSQIGLTHNFRIITEFFIVNYDLPEILRKLQSFVSKHKKLPLIGIASRIHDGQLWIACCHNQPQTGAKFDQPSFRNCELAIAPENQMNEKLVFMVRRYIQKRSLEQLVIYRSHKSSGSWSVSQKKEVSEIQKLMKQSETRFAYVVTKEIVSGSNQPIFKKVVDRIGFTDEVMTQLTAEVSLHSQIKRIPALLAMAQMSIARMVVHYDGFKQSENYKHVVRVNKGLDKQAYKAVKKYLKL